MRMRKGAQPASKDTQPRRVIAKVPSLWVPWAGSVPYDHKQLLACNFRKEHFHPHHTDYHHPSGIGDYPGSGILHIAKAPLDPYGGPVVASHLGIPQTSDVGVQVKLNSLGCSWQCHSSNQQDHQHEVRESGCEVDHLAPAQERGGEREEVRCTLEFPRRGMGLT